MMYLCRNCKKSWETEPGICPQCAAVGVMLHAENNPPAPRSEYYFQGNLLKQEQNYGPVADQG